MRVRSRFGKMEDDLFLEAAALLQDAAPPQATQAIGELDAAFEALGGIADAVAVPYGPRPQPASWNRRQPALMAFARKSKEVLRLADKLSALETKHEALTRRLVRCAGEGDPFQSTPNVFSP